MILIKSTVSVPWVPHPPPPVQSIPTLCFKSCLSLSVTEGSGSILTTCSGGHSYVTCDTFYSTICSPFFGTWGWTPGFWEWCHPPWTTLSIVHMVTLLDGLTWTKNQVIEARLYRASSAVRVLKRKKRVKDFTNYFQGAAWPFFPAISLTSQCFAKSPGTVLWDPLANILSLPTFPWLRREESEPWGSQSAPQNQVGWDSDLLQVPLTWIVLQWVLQYTLHLVLMKLDHYGTIINIVQVSGSYPVLVDPSYLLWILWSSHISCLKTSRL